MLEYIWLLPLGLLIGAYGTLIGAGGGFILVPVLLWVYPETAPEIITSISLAVVSVNSVSGMIAYARMKRIDYRTGLIFAVATIPGAILGAYSTAFVNRSSFDMVFGIVLIITSVILFRRPEQSSDPSEEKKRTLSSFIFPRTDKPLNQFASRRFRVAIILSFIIGYISSMLGIGGGIFQVPLMAYGLNFPVHAAVAISEFVLALKAITASGVHLATGTLQQGIHQTIVLAIGVSIGAQVGARLSNRLKAAWIMQVLAISLAIIGVQFVLTNLLSG